MAQRLAGIIHVQVDGTIYQAKGSFTYNNGSPKREAIVGSDGIHGFKETPQVPFIEGEFTDNKDISLLDLTTIEDATVTIDLANGKMFALSEAYYAGDGDVSTEEGNIGVRFEGESDEVPA